MNANGSVTLQGFARKLVRYVELILTKPSHGSEERDSDISHVIFPQPLTPLFLKLLKKVVHPYGRHDAYKGTKQYITGIVCSDYYPTCPDYQGKE